MNITKCIIQTISFITQAILVVIIGSSFGSQLSNIVPDFSDTPKKEVIKHK